MKTKPMKNYAFVYYCEPNFKSQDEGASYMQKWGKWAGSVGKAWVDPGVPLKRGKIVSSKGVSDNKSKNRVTGYSVVKAESIEAAIELAKKCPHLEHGTVEVAEVMEMKM